MKIESITIWQLRIPFRSPVTTSYGTHTMRETALIEMREADGTVGWGELEALSEPSYSEETHQGALQIIRSVLAPLILGKEFSSVQDISSTWQGVRRNYMAKAALETAAWDMWARRQGLSIAEVLRKECADAEPVHDIPVGISLGMCESEAELLRTVERSMRAGYARVKIKIAPGRALRQVQAIRAEFPLLPLMVDANGSYSPENKKDCAELIELGSSNFSSDLICIEEPFPASDLLAHAWLQERISVPICLDEAVTELDGLRTAHRLGALKMLNLKIARLGGVSAALEIMNYCQNHSIDMWIGGMYQTGIGRTLALHLAALPHFQIPGDLCLPVTYLSEDVLSEPLRTRSGRVIAPSQAGIGVTPSPTLLKAYSVTCETLT